MDLKEVMDKLEALSSEQTKKTLMNHGAKEPLFGVKITDMKKLVKDVKKDQELVRDLYHTGNYDAMYLAGLAINPKQVTKELLEGWLQQANCYAHAEYTVARATAESEFALELAREWIQSEDELAAACGWSTYSNYLSITPDDQINIDEVQQLLNEIEETIHSQSNRVKYNMNGFVISVGAYIKELNKRALEVATTIGKVEVYLGKTHCKVPIAKDNIEKIISMDRVGMKRKRCIC